MFYLLDSIWMLAAAGIIIPVIIHFWNRKQGKTLKVGSISLLKESYEQKAKSLHLQELLLLLLRSILILLVALLLSKPVWQEPLDSKKQQGWVLMEKKDLLQTYGRFKPLVDSLIKQQYEFHYFDEGFAKGDIGKVLKTNSDTASNSSLPYWSLLSALDKQVSSSLPVYLFTANSLSRFTGNRSKVAINLKWYTYTSKDSVSAWLAKAYITSNDSIRLVAASSQPSGTNYSYTNSPVASQKTGDYNIQASNQNLSVSFQNGQPLAVDTTTLKVTLFADNYASDAAYLKAALEAIQQFSKRKIKLSIVNNPAAITSQQDWVFWLSDQPVSKVDGKNIFLYEKGKPESVGSIVKTVNNEIGDEHVSLYKRIAYQTLTSGSFKTTWQDGFGNPLLVVENSTVPVYHFFSHFDPSWNDLPWSNTFPQMILGLIWNQQEINSKTDNRIIDEQQLQPILVAEDKTVPKENFVVKHDLSQALWLAAFIIFFMERYVSFKIKREKANG